MKILNCAILTLALLTQTSAHAVKDVFGTSPSYIRVTESADQTAVKFELCSLIDASACNTIGKKEFYSKK